jgi:hypothetical protein
MSQGPRSVILEPCNTTFHRGTTPQRIARVITTKIISKDSSNRKVATVSTTVITTGTIQKREHPEKSKFESVRDIVLSILTILPDKITYPIDSLLAY